MAALLVAIGASAVAVYALDVAREATSRANIAIGGGPTVTPAAPGTAAPTRAAASPSPSATPSPRTLFVAAIPQTELPIPAAQSSCASVYVDVDALRVGIEAGHEFYLTSCVGPLSFKIDRTSGVTTMDTVPTPQECADQIARTPSQQETTVFVTVGKVFCLLTSAADSQSQGIPQVLAIVEVRSIGTDRSVTVGVSTYRQAG